MKLKKIDKRSEGRAWKIRLKYLRAKLENKRVMVRTVRLENVKLQKSFLKAIQAR